MRRRSTPCCRATRASGSVTVRQTLRELAAMLAQKPGAGNGEFHLAAPPVAKRAPRAAKAATKAVAKTAARKRCAVDRDRVEAPFTRRDVAQPGSAPDWGSGGRWFESSHPDHLTTHNSNKLQGPLLKAHVSSRFQKSRASHTGSGGSQTALRCPILLGTAASRFSLRQPAHWLTVEKSLM